MTVSLCFKALQKLLKLSSLIRCQTELKGAEITADSVTEVEVGMRDAIFVSFGVGRLGSMGIGCVIVVEMEFERDEDQLWWCDKGRSCAHLQGGGGVVAYDVISLQLLQVPVSQNKGIATERANENEPERFLKLEAALDALMQCRK